jgi:hypothetical protein
MEESVGSSDETLSIQDVDDLPEDEQIMALKTIVARLENDVEGAQLLYQQLLSETKDKKQQISNLDAEITAEQVRVVAHFFYSQAVQRAFYPEFTHSNIFAILRSGTKWRWKWCNRRTRTSTSGSTTKSTRFCSS